MGDFYDLPMSGILTTSGNTQSQTSQTVGDFYDVIGRIGSISTLKPGLHISRKDRKHLFANMFLKLSRYGFVSILLQ